MSTLRYSILLGWVASILYKQYRGVSTLPTVNDKRNRDSLYKMIWIVVSALRILYISGFETELEKKKPYIT